MKLLLGVKSLEFQGSVLYTVRFVSVLVSCCANVLHPGFGFRACCRIQSFEF